MAPNLLSLRCIRKREVDHKAQSPQKRKVDIGLEVRGEDRKARILFHPLQKVTHFDVCVAIVAVFHFAALAKKRVGFVKEQYHAGTLGLIEDLAQILLGLTDILAYNRAESDAIEIHVQCAGDHL